MTTLMTFTGHLDLRQRNSQKTFTEIGNQFFLPLVYTSIGTESHLLE